jgi:hypothetical protein
MNMENVNTWLSRRYPLTIIRDRYNGIYSGGDWIAFPFRIAEILVVVNSNDEDCMAFWENYTEAYGLSKSPDAALSDLLDKMMII